MVKSQYDRVGLIPYYLFPEDGTVRKSLYDTSANNCVFDAQWSPTEQEITFTGENYTTEGWDIFLEEVAPLGNEGGSLTNLTSTPGEDERNAVWSPNGEQIVYMKGYEDVTGDLQQELFVIDIKDTSLSPIQLTNTVDEFETNPVWISSTEIAYLSWSPTELVWSLNTISVADQVSKRIMEIPSSWYERN
jgi:Tol biopolymer transport system component